MRSRKGSVTQIILHVGELLLRCGIFNEKKTPRLSQIKYFYREPRCYHTATSDRGCGWEDYPTLTLLPDGKRASGVRGVVITRAMLVYYCRGDTTSSLRNVAITRRHHTHFHYLCGYASPTYFIVRGNREAFFGDISHCQNDYCHLPTPLPAKHDSFRPH